MEIATTSFDQFKFRYKFGNENHLFRISTAYLAAVNVSNSDHSNIGVGVGFGIEFPKKLQEKLSAHYGLEINSKYNYQKRDSNKSYSIGLEGIFGFSYALNEVLYLGAEITPGIYYYHSETNFNSGNSFGFKIDNSVAEIILGFRF